MVQLRVNGEDRHCQDGMSVAALVESLGLGLGYVVVERNGEVVARATAEQTMLAEGDRLELVRAVAGG